MPMPNLLHPVKISIRQLSTTTTMYDEDFREPVGQTKYGSVVIVNGQIGKDDKNEDEVVVTKGGIELKARGYILFRYIDLQKAGITLKAEDRIVKMGWRDVDFYVIELRPTGHWPEFAGATLVKAYYVDKAPSRID